MEYKRYHLWISGRVQGVFYRATCRQVAEELGISGWVRNLPDGRVEAVAEGPSDAMEKFLEWCHQGPPMANVEHVEVQEEEPRQEKGFSIRG